MAHALANLGNEETVTKLGPEDKYFIRRGSVFTNEYARINQESGEWTDGGPGNSNHLLGAFPWLFPYGLGGFEVVRSQNIPYEVHSRWALQYSDRRFQKDYHFVFQIYGVMHNMENMLHQHLCKSNIQVFTITKLWSWTWHQIYWRRQVMRRCIEGPYRILEYELFVNSCQLWGPNVPGMDESRKSLQSKLLKYQSSIQPS